MIRLLCSLFCISVSLKNNPHLSLVDEEYLKVKDITKEALDFSRDTLSAAGPEMLRPLILGGNKNLDSALNRWRNAMNNMSQYDRLRQVALYLLCWGEPMSVSFLNVSVSSSSAQTTTVARNVRTAWNQFLKACISPTSSSLSTGS